MKARVLVAAIFVILGAAAARAAAPRSCVKVIDRAKGAISALGRTGFAPVKAEVATIAKGKKVSFTRELDAGTFATFAVTEEKLSMGLELSVTDAAGKSIKKAEGVGDAFIGEFAVEKKGNVKIELEANDATANDPGAYILVLLSKGEGAPSTSDVIFERLGDRAKALEEAGHQIVYAELDTMVAGKTWTATRKLEAGNYAVEVVSDDEKVKDLEVELTDGAGKSVAKKEKSKEPKDGHMASLKGEAKAGDAKVAVTPVFQEGAKDGFGGFLIAKK